MCMDRLHFQLNDTCLKLKEESLSRVIFYDPLHVSRKLFQCFPGNTTVTRQYFRNVSLNIYVGKDLLIRTLLEGGFR